MKEIPDLKGTLESRLGDKEAMKVLARLAGYIDVPPTIEEFLNDPHFGKEVLGDGKLYGIWQDHLKEIFPNALYTQFHQVCISGSIGGGKSFVCKAGMAYDLCRLLHLKSPQVTYGISKTTPLALVFINATKELSKSVLSGEFIDLLMACPFFRDQQALAKRTNRFATLPHNIKIIAGSRAQDALGKGVISCHMSELNFMGQHQKDQAVQAYVNIERRMKSRFDRGSGLLTSGRLWLESSRKDETGFLETFMNDIEQSQAQQKNSGRIETTLLISHAIWEVKKSSGTKEYSGENFKVYIGQENREPEIVQTSPGGSLGFPEEFCIDVPIEHYEDFYTDIYGALRDFAGVATRSGHRFLPQESLIRESCIITNPCGKEIVDIDSSIKDDELINYVKQAQLPKGHPYFIHFDTAKALDRMTHDKIGIALTRQTDQVLVERAGRKVSNAMTRDYKYETNLAFAVVAKTGQDVPFSRLRNFVVDLSEAGYEIGGVSVDGYQSYQLQQEIRDSGMKVCEISTQKDRDAFELFKDTLLERRWKGPKHELLIKELINLQDMGKLIDHPKDTGLGEKRNKPSKDIADAVAASLMNCKINSGGGKAISAFEQFADQLEKARKSTNSVKDTIKSVGLRKMKDPRKGMGRGYIR